MAAGSRQTQDRRTRHQLEALPANAAQQPAADDALLYPALRFRPEDALHPAAPTLCRASRLRAAYPQLRLRSGRRDYAPRSRARAVVESRANTRNCGAFDRCFRSSVRIDPTRLCAGLVPKHSEIHRRRHRVFRHPDPGRRSNRRGDNSIARLIVNWNVLTACAVLATTTPGIAAPTKLAFEKSDAVWVANIDGSGAKKIANGQSPALSPDGTRLAFNTVQAVGQPAHRKIAVADLATQQVKVFDEVPSDNCLQATWSHDGQRLLFYAYVENEMRIAVMNADGSDFKFISKTGAEHQNYWSATWAHDGQSFFGQDMENLYQLSLDGSVMKKWPIEQLVPHGGMSGNVRLNISPDGKTLLLDVEMDE